MLVARSTWPIILCGVRTWSGKVISSSWPHTSPGSPCGAVAWGKNVCGFTRQMAFGTPLAPLPAVWTKWKVEIAVGPAPLASLRTKEVVQHMPGASRQELQ